MFNEAVKSRGGKMAAAVKLQVPFGWCTRKAVIRIFSSFSSNVLYLVCSRSIFCLKHIHKDLRTLRPPRPPSDVPTRFSVYTIP
ncbi:hypothetical protein ALC62_14339 [Cyphomyrmex costatus]|uniref:Uncharacterized protein n=1 Tax=Cyphomyrmex costatus TaxID=456900 RepID=A0A151I8V7_9HYME|nr:hypothetical protein ALC62_14339 [Cyphomyrmex costatus]